MTNYNEIVIKINGKSELDELEKYCRDIGLGWFTFKFWNDVGNDRCIRLCKTPKHADENFYNKNNVSIILFKEISNNGKIDEHKLNKLIMLNKLENYK